MWKHWCSGPHWSRTRRTGGGGRITSFNRSPGSSGDGIADHQVFMGAHVQPGDVPSGRRNLTRPPLTAVTSLAPTQPVTGSGISGRARVLRR